MTNPSRLETAALVALAQHGYATDRQEYLLQSGNLRVAIRAVLREIRQTIDLSAVIASLGSDDDRSAPEVASDCWLAGIDTVLEELA